MGSAALNLALKAKNALFKGPVGRWILESGGKNLSRHGDAAKGLVTALNANRNLWETRASKRMADFRGGFNTANPSVDLTKQYVGQRAFGIAATDPGTRNFASVQTVIDDLLFTEAHSVGIKVGPRVPYHFPRMWRPDFLKNYGESNAIKHLIAVGDASTASEARGLLNMIRVSGRKVHTLESPRRVNLPGWRQDMAVDIEHQVKVIRRIEEARAFGPKDQNIHSILDLIEEQGGDSMYARLYTELFLGRSIGPGSQIISHGRPGIEVFVNNLEAFSKLSVAVVSNATQPLNTLVLAGISPFVKALRASIADYGSALEFGLRTGGVYHQSLVEFRRLAKVEAEGIGSKVLRYTGFSPIEKFNRIFSANVGKFYAEEQLAKLLRNPADGAARSSLRLLGVDIEAALKSGVVSEGDLLRAGKRVSDLTQFRSTVAELPVHWKRSPAMRILTMYKQFAFNQSRFIKDFAIKPALQGELRPLAYMAFAFPLVGEIAADIKTLIRRGPQGLKDRPQMKFWLDRMIDNFAQVGSLGLIEDLQYAAFSPSLRPITSFVLGPVFGSDVVILGHDLLSSKDGLETLGREITRRLPVVGSLAARELFPRSLRRRSRNLLQKGTYTKMLQRQLRRMSQ